jgi:hypothetical protein
MMIVKMEFVSCEIILYWLLSITFINDINAIKL